MTNNETAAGPVLMTPRMAKEWLEHGEPVPETYIAALRAIASGEAVVVPAGAGDALLRSALERARQDINWMLNNKQFLNGFAFDYIDAALKETGRE